MRSYVSTKPPPLYMGEFGLDLRTNEKSYIQLCGLNLDVRGQEWVVPADLADAIYLDLALPDTFEKRLAPCAMSPNHRVRDAEGKGRHFWLQTIPGEHACAGLMGPACETCIGNRCLSLEDSTGRFIPRYAYMVRFTAQIQKFLIERGYRVDQTMARALEREAWADSESRIHNLWGSDKLF